MLPFKILTMTTTLTPEKEIKVAYIKDIDDLVKRLYDRHLITKEFDEFYDSSCMDLHTTRDLLYRELFNKINITL
jgi:hypothetical protein